MNERPSIDPCVQAIFDLQVALTKKWEMWTEASASNARLRKIATHIFMARWPRQDPDQPVMGFPGAASIDQLPRCGNGTVGIMFPLNPAWTTYLTEAKFALEAIKQSEESA